MCVKMITFKVTFKVIVPYWEDKVMIPRKKRSPEIKELHKTHNRMCNRKRLAIIYVCVVAANG